MHYTIGSCPERKQSCISFVLERQCIHGDGFKIQVMSQQTASEMGDHMILSALITCGIVK